MAGRRWGRRSPASCQQQSGGGHPDGPDREGSLGGSPAAGRSLFEFLDDVLELGDAVVEESVSHHHASPDRVDAAIHLLEGDLSMELRTRPIW